MALTRPWATGLPTTSMQSSPNNGGMSSRKTASPRTCSRAESCGSGWPRLAMTALRCGEFGGLRLVEVELGKNVLRQLLAELTPAADVADRPHFRSRNPAGLAEGRLVERPTAQEFFGLRQSHDRRRHPGIGDCRLENDTVQFADADRGAEGGNIKIET